VFVDGWYRKDLSSFEQQIEGVSLNNLASILADETQEIENYFGRSLPKQQHGFSALNTAYCQDGYVLKLADNASYKGVLEMLFISSHNEDQYPVSHSRNLIIAGANSKCTIIERHVGNQNSVYLKNTITEIFAADNAHIDHYKIHQESNDAFHIGGVFIQQAGNSQVKNHNIGLTGLMTRNDISSHLLGQGAHIEMNGLVIGNGRQHFDNHTEVNHAVANCTSDEYYKTILDDHSRSVFRGRIVVAQDAQLTNADQQNKNLLLSANAEADTKPQLEIYADDVLCSHGATVGQLDPKSMFYLKSRGIDHNSAKALLTFAFANQLIERVEVQSIRDELTQLIAGQLLTGLEELI
jgi:Fe-S cluster assembly protein SufD